MNQQTPEVPLDLNTFIESAKLQTLTDKALQSMLTAATTRQYSLPDTPPRILGWPITALVAIFYRNKCTHCESTVIYPGSATLLLRRTNPEKQCDHFEAPIVTGIPSPRPPTVYRWFTRTSSFCHLCTPED